MTPQINSAKLMMKTSAKLVEIVGSIVDIGDVTCLVDSGSTHSFINPRVLAKLGTNLAVDIDAS